MFTGLLLGSPTVDVFLYKEATREFGQPNATVLFTAAMLYNYSSFIIKFAATLKKKKSLFYIKPLSKKFYSQFTDIIGSYTTFTIKLLKIMPQIYNTNTVF